MFESVLVANRGEIARRVIRSAQEIGVRAIAVYSEADADLPYVREASAAVCIGPAQPAQSYLAAEKLIAAARQTGAQAIHPGYGFLSEDAGFASRVIEAGLIWVGPPPDVITAMGNKVNARNLLAAAGVPVFAGTTEPVRDLVAARRAAGEVGFPLMVKAACGGGGIGMTVVEDAAALDDAVQTASARGLRFFGSADLLLERYVRSARHVEVQILGLPDGRVLCLGERDCSIQRRHQKVVEESPAAHLSEEVRTALHRAAVRAGEAVGYRGAGTVEFLYDSKTGELSFLEMNTRLQVEHPVTELVTGTDLVRAQLAIAAGERLDWFDGPVRSSGHAVELRVYAEDPVRFLPSPGRITRWREPSGPGVRVDAGYAEGNTVTPFYDPLLAKLCALGRDRTEALDRARAALDEFVIDGPRTNLPFLAELLDNPSFRADTHDTLFVTRLRSAPAA